MRTYKMNKSSRRIIAPSIHCPLSQYNLRLKLKRAAEPLKLDVQYFAKMCNELALILDILISSNRDIFVLGFPSE